MVGAIATAVAELAKIGNKVMEWFSPGIVEKKHKAKLDMLEKEKAAILSQPATTRNSKRLAKIIKEISELRSKLHT